MYHKMVLHPKQTPECAHPTGISRLARGLSSWSHTVLNMDPLKFCRQQGNCTAAFPGHQCSQQHFWKIVKIFKPH